METVVKKRAVALASILLGALLSAAQAPTDASSREQAAAKAKTERESRGVFNSAKLDDERKIIDFTYGSPERKVMSFTEFEAFVRARLAGNTLAFQDFRGAQIEYYSPDGRVWLWYPGNKRAVPGRYYTKQVDGPVNAFGDRPAVLICFDYGPNSYNPTSGKVGGEECDAAYAYIASIRGRRSGDVFNLASGNVPSVMSARRPPRWPDRQPLIPKIAPHN